MVGFVKVDPMEASALDMTNATRGQPTRFLGLGFSVVSLGVRSWKDPRLMGGEGESRLSSLVQRPAKGSVRLGL